MEYNIRSGDDYLEYVADSLDEVKREIDSAATVFVENDEARRQLGEALGQARNALTRAHRDLNAHVARQQRCEDRSIAENYFESLRLIDDDLPQIVVAIVPLPLEEERLALDTFAKRTFQSDFTNWVTRFNHDERRNTPAKYLLEIPGSSMPRSEQGHFAFEAMPQGGTERSQSALLYQSGAFVFKSRLYSWTDPPSFTIDLILEEVRATIKFVLRLYEELNVVPRSVAVQAAITKVHPFHMKTPARFSGFIDWLPNADVVDIVAPYEPLIMPFTAGDETIRRILPAIESSVQSRYTRSPANG